jgi:hypothetical protein
MTTRSQICPRKPKKGELEAPPTIGCNSRNRSVDDSGDDNGLRFGLSPRPPFSSPFSSTDSRHLCRHQGLLIRACPRQFYRTTRSQICPRKAKRGSWKLPPLSDATLGIDRWTIAGDPSSRYAPWHAITDYVSACRPVHRSRRRSRQPIQGTCVGTRGS